jgi:hypothetical protein
MMAESGYDVRTRHATMAGSKQMGAGAELTAITHNVVFAPVV